MIVKIHFMVSAFIYLTGIILSKMYEQRIKQNGWKEWKKGKQRKKRTICSKYTLYCLIPIFNLIIVFAVFVMIRKTPEEFEGDCNKIKDRIEKFLLTH